MSSHRRHATRPDAVERAMRQILRHRMETKLFEKTGKPPTAVLENLVRGMESLRASLENWPVPPPLFRSQDLPPVHDVMGCTGAWTSHMNGLRKCADCGTEMSSVLTKSEVVGYQRTGNSSILRCLDHPPHESMSENYIPVTSENLENGGICTRCGNDLLAHPGAKQ